MDTITPIAVISTGTAPFERFDGFDAVLAGEPQAEVAWLRTSSTSGGTLFTGLFAVRPSTFRYTFAADESFHVIEGAVEIVIDGGASVNLRAGDCASFPAGATSTWTVTETLRKFFVISG